MSDPLKMARDAEARAMIERDVRARMNDDNAVAILTARQFSRRDVLELTGLTDAQLKNTLDRDLVRLDVDHNPGTGRRRMFTGSDVLKLTVAHTMSAIGYPMRWSYLIADQVEGRAKMRLFGGPIEFKVSLALYPNASGDDWAYTPLGDQLPREPLPFAYQVLEVDRLIDDVLAKLRALVAEEAIPGPAFEFPEPAASPYSPENDFFRAWTVDELGRNVRVGLTYDETLELDGAKARYVAGSREAGARWEELHDRHETARLKRIAEASRNPPGEEPGQ